MVRVLSLAFCFVVVSAASLIGREWTDRSGKHRIEATLVELGKDSVRLKKPDGKIVTLPLDQLSQADREFLAAEAKKVPHETAAGAKPAGEKSAEGTHTLSASVKTYNDLESLAKKQTTISAVLSLYQLFLDDARIDETEKKLARERLPYWEELKTNDAVRVGGKWVTAAELQELRGEAARLVAEAGKLLETGSSDLAEGKLVAASKANPTGVTANFLLGLYHSLNKRSSPAAEKDFTECVKRLKRKESLSNEDRANLLASLNNLAIVEARQKKHAAAVKHWKEASQVAPPPVEVIQNVGRFVHLARAAPMLGIPKETEKSAGNLFASLAAPAQDKSFSPRIGWLYIGVFDSDETPDEDSPPKRSSPSTGKGKRRAGGAAITVGFGSGFVVHPGYVITNHHVAGDADELVIHTRANQAVRHKARLIATSPNEDVALLECKELAMPAVAFSLEAPKLASDLLVLGYPEPENIGTDLKATRGSITGLPNPNVDNLLIYDATTNGGNSGGPVCDQRGQAIAVHSTGYQLSGKLAGGVPAAVALAFVKKELPGFEQPLAAKMALDWPQVAETVGQSTVQIEVLMTPAKLRSISKAGAKQQDADSDVNAYEDPWCMFCHGSGEIKCPARDCAKGTVPATATSVVAVNPASGQRFTSTVDTQVRCPTCGGKGHVPCRYCVGGIDPTVIGRPGR